MTTLLGIVGSVVASYLGQFLHLYGPDGEPGSSAPSSVPSLSWRFMHFISPAGRPLDHALGAVQPQWPIHRPSASLQTRSRASGACPAFGIPIACLEHRCPRIIGGFV